MQEQELVRTCKKLLCPQNFLDISNQDPVVDCAGGIRKHRTEFKIPPVRKG